VKKEEKNKG